MVADQQCPAARQSLCNLQGRVKTEQWRNQKILEEIIAKVDAKK